MCNDYKEIELNMGSDLEETVNKLLEYKTNGENVYCVFNGKKLFSNSVTMDSAFLEVTGKTKVVFDCEREEWFKRYDEKKRLHEESIPEKTLIWKEEGRKILSEDKWDFWDEIVPIRLNDLYEGMELGATLEIVATLNKGGTLEKAKEVIYNQNHSGMSFGLVRAMVRAFCDRGEEFSDYLN